MRCSAKLRIAISFLLDRLFSMAGWKSERSTVTSHEPNDPFMIGETCPAANEHSGIHVRKAKREPEKRAITPSGA